MRGIPNQPFGPLDATSVARSTTRKEQEQAEPDWDRLSWPLAQLGEALEILAQQRGLSEAHSSATSATLSVVPPSLTMPNDPAGTQARIGEWLAALAHHYGLEAEPSVLLYPALEPALANSKEAPALLLLPAGLPEDRATAQDTGKAGGDGDKESLPRFLALLKGRGNGVVIIAPDYRRYWLPVKQVRAALCQPLEATHAASITGLIERAAIPPSRQAGVRAAFLGERLSATSVRLGWRLRLSPGGSFWKQLRHEGLLGRLGAALAGNMVFYLFYLLSWAVIGQGTLSGQFETGWLVAWFLFLISGVPARLVNTWAQGALAINFGRLLKRRLLYGVLQVDSEYTRKRGVGQLLGEVVEVQTVETLLQSGSASILLALVQFVLTWPILLSGAGGGLEVVLFSVWAGFSFILGWRYLRWRQRWTEQRVRMTHSLIEGMVGHRTRLAQEPPEEYHRDEDPWLEAYLTTSVHLDRQNQWLLAALPRGWIIVGLLGLLPSLLTGSSSLVELAITVGGIAFGLNAIAFVSIALPDLAGALVGWQQVAPLFRAGRDGTVKTKGGADQASQPFLTKTAENISDWVALDGMISDGIEEGQGQSEGSQEPTSFQDQTHFPKLTTPREQQEWRERPGLLEAHRLVYRYYKHGAPVLDNCNLKIKQGERLLIEGPSGGGKSTLASLLAGLRQPEAGLLMLKGLDRATLGFEGWRRYVVAAPQFHENHVLTETFAFNLLLGRGWPPNAPDLEEAEVVCRELGLGPLLDRMPGGLMQMVGETGWQLSHGERSRLYIARTLLQGAELIVLDESFAALDPETLQQALECVLRRAKTLIVIAHP